MKDEPRRPPRLGEPSQSPLNIDSVTGHVIVVEQARRPEIPEGKGRTCPQCHATAWRRSRFCWCCQFDFDRADLPRCHPRKLLIVALSINLAVLALVLFCYLNGKRGPNPTSLHLGSTRTAILAPAGTLVARLGAFMTEQRKVDVSGIWKKSASADINETLRARERPAPAPLVSVGTVRGNVITINSAAGLDLAALLAGAPPAGAQRK